MDFDRVVHRVYLFPASKDCILIIDINYFTAGNQLDSVVVMTRQLGKILYFEPWGPRFKSHRRQIFFVCFFDYPLLLQILYLLNARLSFQQSQVWKHYVTCPCKLDPLKLFLYDNFEADNGIDYLWTNQGCVYTSKLLECVEA